MRTFAEFLKESMETINIGSKDLVVLIDPTPNEFEAFLQKNQSDDGDVRALADTDGTLYIWNALEAIHDHVVNVFGEGFRLFLFSRNASVNVENASGTVIPKLILKQTKYASEYNLKDPTELNLAVVEYLSNHRGIRRIFGDDVIVSS